MVASDTTLPNRNPERPNGGTGRRDRSAFKGLRVLVVEDEFLLALLLEEELVSAGCSVVGPFSGLAQAMEAARRETFDLAILDINLNGEMVYPLADELSGSGVPFIFMSGYGLSNLPERFRTAPRIAKPYDPAILVREMQRALPGAG